MRKWFSNSWESEWLCSAVSLPRVPLPFLILNVGSQKKFRVLINLSGCSCSNMLSCPYQQFFVTGGTACAKKRTAAIQLAGKERTEGFLWDKEEHGFCSLKQSYWLLFFQKRSQIYYFVRISKIHSLLWETPAASFWMPSFWPVPGSGGIWRMKPYTVTYWALLWNPLWILGVKCCIVTENASSKNQ